MFLARKGFDKDIYWHFSRKDLFNSDIIILNFLAKPVLIYINILKVYR